MIRVYKFLFFFLILLFFYSNVVSAEIFGDNTINTTTLAFEDVIRGCSFTCPSNGKAMSITVYMLSSVAGKNIKCALYYASNYTLVGYGVTEQRNILGAAAWQTFNFNSPYPDVIGGVDYILCVWSESGGGVAITYWDAEIQTWYFQNIVYGVFPDPGVFTSAPSRNISIYCTYLSFPFTVSNVYPGNLSSNIPMQPTIYFTLNHSRGDMMNYSIFYGLSEGNENILINSSQNVVNNTFNSLFFQASDYSTVYYWRVMLDDGLFYTNYTFNFRTVGYIGQVSSNSIALAAAAFLIGLIPLVFVINRKRDNINI